MTPASSSVGPLAAAGGLAALVIGALTWTASGEAPSLPAAPSTVATPRAPARSAETLLVAPRSSPLDRIVDRTVGAGPSHPNGSQVPLPAAAEELIAVVARRLGEGGDRRNFDALVGAVADELGAARAAEVRAVAAADGSTAVQLAVGAVLRRLHEAGGTRALPPSIVAAARSRALPAPVGLEGLVAARLVAAFGTRIDREWLLAQLAHPDATVRSTSGLALRQVPAGELFGPLAEHLEAVPEVLADAPLALLRHRLARAQPNPLQESELRRALDALIAHTARPGLARRATSVLASIPTPGGGLDLVDRFERSQPGDGEFERLAQALAHLADPLALQELAALADASLAGPEHRSAAERALTARGVEH